MRISNWSSDVCSSDLDRARLAIEAVGVDLVGESREQADIIGAVSEAEVPVHLGRAFEQVGEGVPAERERGGKADRRPERSEEHTSELQSLMRISYAVFCLKKKTATITHQLNSARQN